MSVDNQDPVPFVDLALQFSAMDAEIMDAVGSVAEKSSFIRGPALGEFEKKFAELHGVRHAIGVASGTDALSLAVRALGIGPGDEVITVPNTWISTVFAISHSGAVPVFVDIDPDTYQMDPVALESAITSRTKAVIPVHLFGHPAPISQIVAICRPNGIRIIEDVAQALLAREQGGLAGAIGDIGCFSFYPSKNLGAYGDGGLVLTKDDALAEKLLRYANYGQSGRTMSGFHDTVGYNSRLDTIQAAILLCKLPHLGDWTEARRKAAVKYDELLQDLPIKRPTTAPGAEPVYHLYVVQVNDRDACHAYLRENGVMAQIHYPMVVHLQDCYRNLGYKEGDFPVAESACKRTISLPMFPEITTEQIERVVDTLAGFVKKADA